MMKDMAGKLAEQLTGVIDPQEMNAIIDAHNQQLSQMEDNFLQDKERQQRELQEKLKGRREKKMEALKWKHEQLVSAQLCIKDQFIYI